MFHTQSESQSQSLRSGGAGYRQQDAKIKVTSPVGSIQNQGQPAVEEVDGMRAITGGVAAFKLFEQVNLWRRQMQDTMLHGFAQLPAVGGLLPREFFTFYRAPGEDDWMFLPRGR